MKIESMKRDAIHDPNIKRYESEKTRNDHLEREMNRFRTENNNLKRKITDIIETKNSSVVSNFLSSREIRTTQNNLSSMKSEINSLQNENMQLKNTIRQSAKNQCQDHLYEINNLKKINMQQSTQISDLKTQLQNMSVSLSNSQRGGESFEVLKRAYDENKNQNLKYLKMIKSLKEQLNNQSKIQIQEITETYNSTNSYSKYN